MRIAVDAMGGDHAPAAAVAGATAAARQDGTAILLVGRVPVLQAELEGAGGIPAGVQIVAAEEVVEMDEPATTPMRRKRHSSVRLCAELVRDGKAAAMVTAGNTGAALVAAKLVIGTIEGVDRPALAAVLPNPDGPTVLLDVGANIDSRAEHLRQFAVMGHSYAQEVLGLQRPRVGLLSIGGEAAKGTELTRQVFEVMQTTGLNFVGNVEGSDVFGGAVDVVVCDGFVGNVLLKGAEALAELVGGMMRQELNRDLRGRLGAVLAGPALRRLEQRTDYREQGGAPLLGLAGGCFIGHGRSDAHAVQAMVRRAADFGAAHVHDKIRRKVAQLHAEEERLLLPESETEVSA